MSGSIVEAYICFRLVEDSVCTHDYHVTLRFYTIEDKIKPCDAANGNSKKLITVYFRH